MATGRWAVAQRVKKVKAVNLPPLRYYKGKLYPYQEKAVAFLYFIGRGGLFDAAGTGKTHVALGLLALLKARGELGRCLYLAPAADLLSKAAELEKFTTLQFAIANGTAMDRMAVYNCWADICVVSYEVARANDLEYLLAMEFDTVVLDESHVFRNKNTKTADAVLQLADSAVRCYTLSATPLQMSLLDVWTTAATWHRSLFGNFTAFKRRYCEIEKVRVWYNNGSHIKDKIVGYKNMAEFSSRFSPFYIRRVISEIEAELPELVSDIVWGSLTDRQSTIYTRLKKGAIKLLQEGRAREVRSNLHTMQMLVDASDAVGDNAPASWKMEWLLRELTTAGGMDGSMAHEKVVVFAMHKATIAALVRRLEEANIKYIVMTGDDSKEVREARRRAFWNDPAIRVCIGTQAIEASLNLQCARYLIALDTMYNPQRMTQLVGRIRRVGSRYKSVVFLQLLTRGTFEERIQDILAERNALTDVVFTEDTSLFGRLTDEHLARLFR